MSSWRSGSGGRSLVSSRRKRSGSRRLQQTALSPRLALLLRLRPADDRWKGSPWTTPAGAQAGPPAIDASLRLASAVCRSPPDARARELFALACAHDTEGIVGKWAKGRYHVDGSTTSWPTPTVAKRHALARRPCDGRAFASGACLTLRPFQYQHDRRHIRCLEAAFGSSPRVRSLLRSAHLRDERSKGSWLHPKLYVTQPSIPTSKEEQEGRSLYRVV